MKKIVYLLIIIFCFFLIGCHKTYNGLISNEVDTVNLSLFDDSMEENTIIIDGDKLVEFKENINSIYYEETYPFVLKAKYLIEYNETIIYIFDSLKFSVCEEGIEKFYYVVKSDFSFLDAYEFEKNESIYLKDILVIKEYGQVLLTKVELNKTIDISENTDLKEQLNIIKLLEVNVGAGIDEYKYILTFYGELTEDEWSIYLIENNLIICSGRYYQIVEGSFAFLDEIEFNSTGWMPWV